MPIGVYPYKKGHQNYNKMMKGCFKKGHNVPEEWRKKYRNAFRGKKRKFKNPILRNSNISKAKKGIPHLNQRREQNGNWKGGKTKLRIWISTITEYKDWRSRIFERDNWTCQTCNRRSKIGEPVFLEAHHIKSFSKIVDEYKITTVDHARRCKELWDITNGVTLCRDCHKLTDNFGNKN